MRDRDFLLMIASKLNAGEGPNTLASIAMTLDPIQETYPLYTVASAREACEKDNEITKALDLINSLPPDKYARFINTQTNHVGVRLK